MNRGGRQHLPSKVGCLSTLCSGKRMWRARRPSNFQTKSEKCHKSTLTIVTIFIKHQERKEQIKRKEQFKTILPNEAFCKTVCGDYRIVTILYFTVYGLIVLENHWKRLFLWLFFLFAFLAPSDEKVPDKYRPIKELRIRDWESRYTLCGLHPKQTPPQCVLGPQMKVYELHFLGKQYRAIPTNIFGEHLEAGMGVQRRNFFDYQEFSYVLRLCPQLTNQEMIQMTIVVTLSYLHASCRVQLDCMHSSIILN